MACPDGQYFCHDRGKCMPIPNGHKVRKDGELVKEAKKFSDLSTQRKPGEKKKPKKKREGYIFDTSQPPSKKVTTEAVKGQDTASRREGAKERAAEKKSGKIRQNTLSPKDYATQQKKSIEWHDKRTKGRYIPGQISDVNEVAPPGWGHTKAEKEKTDPSKPKSKIGGTAAAFKRALDRGDFKGLPGDKTKKEKTASMFKLMWSMKKKGDKPHYKPGTDEKYKKYQEEETSMPNVSKKDKGAIKKRYKNLFTRDVSGTKQGVNESLSGKDAKKLEKASVFSYSDDPKKQDIARAKQVEVDYKDLIRQLKSKKKKSGNTNVNESYEIGEASFSDWRKKATDAVKKVAGKKPIKKHEYPGRDAGKEAKQRLSKRDHETVNFLDPDD